MANKYLSKEEAEALAQRGAVAGLFPERYMVSDSFGGYRRNLNATRGRRKKRSDFNPNIMRNGLSKSEAKEMRNYVEHLPLGIQYETDENGKRYWRRNAGDHMSLDDIMKFIDYTPEFSQQYADSGKFRDIITPGDFVDWAFTKSGAFNMATDAFACPEECHIEKMEYLDRWQMLKVYFKKNNTIVVYTRVPYEVFSKLKYYAEDRAMGVGVDGKPHTLVGIAFWDYVRIRGTRHGNQYPAMHLDENIGRHGVGFNAEAAARASGDAGHRTGADGKPVEGEKGKARAARYSKPTDFLVNLKELDAKDIEGIRRIAGDLADKDDTITEALAHGDIRAAKGLANEFETRLLKSDRTSDSIKNKLKKIARDPKLSEPYAPLIEMEKYAVSQKLWPL